MRIIIIGGGLTGLSAAYELSRNDKNEIIIYEKENELGGMLSGYKKNNYSIEKYYHHIFLSDKKTPELLKELGLIEKLKWLGAKNSYWLNGKLYCLNTPLDFLKLPDFGIADLAKLVFFVYKIKNTSDYDKLDETNVKQWVIDSSNQNIWNNFVAPLLESKFGKNADNISAAWFAKRIKIRSHRKWNGETLGYLDGGFTQIIDKMANKIKINGGKIWLDREVKSILIENQIAKGVVLENGQIINTDKIIYTGSEKVLGKMISGNMEFPEIKYQGTICALLGLKNKLTENTYWLNIRDKEIPFRALIEHTNFISEEKYKGNHLVYLTSYFQDETDQIARMESKNVFDLYIKALKKMFPNLNENDIIWKEMKREFPTAPVYEKGYLKKIIPYKTAINNLFVAGINSEANYPERSIEGSVCAGFNVAKIVAET